MKRSVDKLVALQIGLCLFGLGCEADGTEVNQGDACVIGTLGCSCSDTGECTGGLICVVDNICAQVDAGTNTNATFDANVNIDSGHRLDGNVGTGPRAQIDATADTKSIVYPDSGGDTATTSAIDAKTDSGTEAAVKPDSTTPQSGRSNGTLSFTYQPKDERPPMLVFAIWMENSSGEYLNTISIGDFIGSRGGGNRGNPDIDSVNNGDRISSLPIWAYRRNVIDTTFGYESLYPPPSSSAAYPEDIDAVTTATPAGGTTQVTTFELADLPYGRYNFFMEANHSFDQNSNHDYSWYRGQPSVIWTVSLDIGDSPQSVSVLDYMGYGSADGTDGEVRPADSTITTAADLITDIGGYRFKVDYTP